MALGKLVEKLLPHKKIGEEVAFRQRHLAVIACDLQVQSKDVYI